MSASSIREQIPKEKATDGGADQRGRGRPRSSHSHEAILAAVGLPLRKLGLPNLTVETVLLTDARVRQEHCLPLGESKHAVAIDVILRMINAELKVPDTESTLRIDGR
jgi:hypothetical protein